jgi:hypothetical protein
MVLKKIGAMSCAKVSGVLYAAMGLIIGFFFSLISVFAAMFGSSGHDGAAFGFLFGIGAVILMPIFYGVIGFVATLIAVSIFNFIVNYTGGIEMTFEEEMRQGPTAANQPGTGY